MNGKTREGLFALSVQEFSAERDLPMNVSIRLENEAKQTYSVYVDDTRIARGLPKAEAHRVRVQAMNGTLKLRLG